MMLGQSDFVARTLGKLFEGAEVVTISKMGGVIRALNSMTYYGNQMFASPAAQAAANGGFPLINNVRKRHH
jgi:hypothetical protein